MSLQFKEFVYYGVGALALIALAGVFPKGAILLTVILIAGLVLTHWKEYADYLQPPTAKKK